MSLSHPPSAQHRLSAPPGTAFRERYEVQGLIASGGMGAVYRVRDTVTGETVALKRINSEALDDERAVESFEREYQVLAGLSHPRIISVFDYGVDARGPYYTMELVDGMDMAEAAPLSYRDCCRYLRDVATSLALLHARRLVHRDLSATNVRRTGTGHCKLLDFGTLAPFGYAGQIAGTPPFIAPEAVRSGSIDHRADLFALGALAYWMLTKRHAFPATRLEDLRPLWRISPPPPSELASGVPPELDALVLSLLRLDPLARPTSAAEVIAMLDVIGDLPPEVPEDAERLAQSFLANPRFVGRKEEMSELESCLGRALSGQGAAIRVEAISGMGRTRLLEELGLRAQVAGAVVLRVDASTHSQPLGVARALVARMLERSPALARAAWHEHRDALAVLGPDMEARLGGRSPNGADRTATGQRRVGGSLAAWFEEISRKKPIVIEVDDVECADEASFGLLATLASRAGGAPILLVVTERIRGDVNVPVGLRALRSQCASIALSGLSAAETLELTRSIFGDAPNAARYTEWIHERTAGSALHFLETARHLAAKRVLRYVAGGWVLPAERPISDPPHALEDALAARLGTLGEEARRLAECLALQRARRPTLELCRLLVDEADRGTALSLLDELERQNVLHADGDGYRFGSLALSEAVLRAMSPERTALNHRRLGKALLSLSTDDPGVAIEAGWHLMKGGEEQAGADCIAEVTFDGPAVIRLIGNLSRLGGPVEAALHVYKRNGASLYRRLPLLAALAYAAYYEDRVWGERYGDEALDALEEACGLRIARRVGRFLGPALGLVVGVAIAFVRYHLAPRKDHACSFGYLFTRLFGVVTTLAAISSISFDSARVARVGQVLEPFAFLPERMAPVGIRGYCVALGDLCREEPAIVAASVDALIERFEQPEYYRSLSNSARRLFVAGLHFCRGILATFEEDGAALQRSAMALDRSGMKLYAMLASQLRFLHHENRGEVAAAARHREQVELHAAHVGSAWQAELWEGLPLLAAYSGMSDLTGMMRLVDQLTNLSATVPSAVRYSALARLALRVTRADRSTAALPAHETDLAGSSPRSFLGWSLAQALIARGHNQAGEFEAAKTVCERALARVTDGDRKFVALFLALQIEMAHTEAALGDVGAALTRIDGLIDRSNNTENGLAKGLLHEARALICFGAGRKEGYVEGLANAERWLRPTGAPALIAKCERLAARGDSRLRSSGNPLETVLANHVTTVSASSFPESVPH
jgi:hypothetical protein